MMAKSKVYLGGVGASSLRTEGSAKKDSASFLVSAATKALLDAGITYDNVTRGVRRKSSNQGAEAFRAFGDQGVTITEVEDGTELQSSFTMVQDRGEQCVLVIAADKVRVCEQDFGHFQLPPFQCAEWALTCKLRTPRSPLCWCLATFLQDGRT